MARSLTNSHLRALLGTVFTLISLGCGNDSADIGAISPANITVTPGEVLLLPEEASALEAKVYDLEGRLLRDREITWSSSNPGIASVSLSGVVTALAPGTASIGAHSEQSVGFAEIVVQPDFQLPLGQHVVVTEMGTPTTECPDQEGGLRVDGSRDCSHAGLARYSLDLADPEQWEGSPDAPAAQEVFAAADGTIIDICLQPPTEITCGPNGPFVLIQHSGGFLTMYAHVDPASISLRRKTPVLRGQPLGTMGAWGADPAPWLHFEVRHQPEGGTAASILESLRIEGRRMRDYKVTGP
jgi:hypothetical protein